MLRDLARLPGLRHGLLAVLLASTAVSALSQRPVDSRPPPIPLEEGLRQGRALVADLLARRPDENTTNTGVVKIRDDTGHERTVPIRFSVFSTPTNWVSIYEVRPGPGELGDQSLTVIHRGPGETDEYLLSGSAAPEQTHAAAPGPVAAQAMVPFAGSDFWFADLGLQFLSWPRQRVLRREMRHSQPCEVLESTASAPSATGYCRVVSWVDPENGAVIHADAYDARGKLLKEFDPKTLKRVRGQQQLEEIEMRNVQTGSRTVIQFNL
jgi:Outer membrane lipoprotein-sorting protein